MKILMESTDQITSLDGVPVRVWQGTTEAGVPCKVFVHRLAVASSEDSAQFDEELRQQLPPGRSVDLRTVL
jgi:hypothetical protein